MGFRVDFGDGKSADFDGDTPPTQQEIEELEAQLYGPQKKQESSTLGQDLRAGLATVGKNTASALGALESGIAGLAAKYGPAYAAPSTEYQDRAIEIGKGAEQFWDSHIQNEVGGKKQGWTGKAATGLAQAPAWLNPISGPLQIAGLAADQGRSVIDDGGDLTTAMQAYGISAATNTALMALPASIRAGIIARIAAGGSLGALETWLEPAAINELRKAAGVRELPMPEGEDYAAGIAMGGAFGAAGPGPRRAADADLPEAPSVRVDDTNVLDAPEGSGIRETPEQIEMYKQLAEQKAQQMRDTPIQMTPDGQAIPQALTDATRPIDQQQVVAPQYGRGFDPEAARQAAMRDMSAEHMSLADSSQYPINDGGTRPTGTDGTPLRGMAEDVPTIDFPLRQEVLQNPHVKGAITRFRNRADSATTPEAKAKVENDFAAYMKRYGIGDAADAHGLRRALYETNLKNPMGIRKSGELNLDKSNMDGPGLDFIKANSKKQGGFVNPSIFSKERTFSKNIGGGREIVATSIKGRRAGDSPLLRVSIRENGQEIGGGAVFKPEDIHNLRDTHLKGHVGLPESHRGTGLGEEIYRFVAELGNDIKRGPAQSKAGQGMWDGFERRGLATGGSISAFPKKGVSDAFIKSQKKQSGAALTDLLSGGLSSVFDKMTRASMKPHESTSALAKPEHQRRAMEKIPGMKMGDYVSKDIPPDTLIAERKKNPKDITRGWAAIGGSEMVAAIKNDPVVYAVGQWFTNAHKRADLYYSAVLKDLHADVKKTISNKKEGQLLMKILREEDKQNARYAPEQLGRLGLSPQAQETYKALRREYDVALKRINQARKEQGLEEVTPRDAYVASTFKGDWKVPIYDKSGRLVWYVAEHSKAQANHALEWLKKNMPDLDYSKATVEYSKNPFLNQEASIMSSYKDLLKVFGKNDPVVQALAAAREQYVSQQGYDMFGQPKHFEPKHGVRGGMGDRPWVNDAKNTKDFFEAQMEILRNSHMWAEQQTAFGNVKQFLSDPDIQANYPNLSDWVKDRMYTERGSATHNLVAGFEKLASKGLGHLGDLYPPIGKHIPTDLSSIHQGVRHSKSLFYTKNLGLFNIPFAVMSLVQPVFTLPHHLRLSNEGYKHNALRTTMEGTGYAARSLLNHYSGGKTNMDGVPRFWKEAMAYLEANGISDMNQYADVGGVAVPGAVTNLRKVANLSISEPERVARTNAFMAYVSHLKQSGKYEDPMTIFQKAEELTNLSMANYRHTERANMFNKMGMVGDAAAALQTFKINQMNQIWNFYRHGQRTGDWTPLVAQFGVQFALAGGMGFYGVDAADDAWNVMKAIYVAGGGKDKDLISSGIKKSMIASETIPDAVKYGISSLIPGEPNFQAKMDMSVLYPNTIRDLFPWISDYGNMAAKSWAAATEMAKGNNAKKEKDRAAHALMPASMKPWTEMNAPTLSSPTGDAIALSDPEMRVVHKRSDLEKKMKGLPFAGMTSVTETAAKNQEFNVKASEALINQAQEQVSRAFKDAVQTNDPQQFASALADYAELGGDVGRLIQSMDDTIFAQYLRLDQELMMKARTPQQIERLKRYLDATRALRK